MYKDKLTNALIFVNNMTDNMLPGIHDYNNKSRVIHFVSAYDAIMNVEVNEYDVKSTSDIPHLQNENSELLSASYATRL